MTAEELIQLLQMGLERNDGNDYEIRLAVQPNWPFEHKVQQFTLRNLKREEALEEVARMKKELDSPDSGLTEDERQEVLEHINEAKADADNLPLIGYLCEGSHIGYASKNLWEETDLVL